MSPSPAPRAAAKAPRRGRPVRKSAKSPQMREALLDHAEALFARHGMNGVSVRDVARAAAVDPALVHYYFETKQGLFDAVLARRADVVNSERVASMEAYARAAGSELTAEGVIAAFLKPILLHATSGDPGWKNYYRLLAVVNNTPLWGGEIMSRHFDPVIRQLIDLLRKCLPQASDTDLYWSYHFLSGALTLSLSETGRIDRLSGGLCASSDMESILRRLVTFGAGGFERTCRPSTETSANPDGRSP